MGNTVRAPAGGGRGGRGRQGGDAARTMPPLARGGISKPSLNRASAARAVRQANLMEPVGEARPKRVVANDFNGDGGKGDGAPQAEEASMPPTQFDADAADDEDEEMEGSAGMGSIDAEQPNSNTLQRTTSAVKTPSSTSTRVRPSSGPSGGGMSAAERLRRQDNSDRIRILEVENENMRLKLQLAELQASNGTGNVMGRTASGTGVQSIAPAAAQDNPYFSDQVSKEVSKLTMAAIKDGHFLDADQDICTFVFNGLDPWASLNDPQYLEGRSDYFQQWWTHKGVGRKNAHGYSLWKLKFSDNAAQIFNKMFNDYIQVANGAPRPIVPKGMEAVEAEVTAHTEWCKRILNTGPDGRGYRRQSDAADNTAFVASLGNAFDKTAIQHEPGNKLVLATNPDGSCKKPCVTLQQLAAVSFKMKDRLITGAGEAKPGLKQCHLQPMRDEVELLRTEILDDGKPLSRILIKTDDEELLTVLGGSGVRIAATETE